MTKKKVSNAIAPNFIHALDAAHMARTVNAPAPHANIDLMAVHDFLAVSPLNAEMLNQIVRDQFVRMYVEFNPLEDIREAAIRGMGVIAIGTSLRGRAPKSRLLLTLTKYTKPPSRLVANRTHKVR